ncbi:MAG: hypothetical protein GY866_17085 [Proteobacteria bacterium]|nr:hypothetical protein [Pseudomonadota bacterium]
MNRTIHVEDLLQRYSEEQILRAIVNSYKSIISSKDSTEDLPVVKTVMNTADPITTKNMADPAPTKTDEPVKTSDHPPCSSCGGSFFLRTGTCHVCQTCGTSQGCS